MTALLELPPTPPAIAAGPPAPASAPTRVDRTTRARGGRRPTPAARRGRPVGRRVVAVERTSAPASVRLTRRGRLLVTLCVLVVSVGLLGVAVSQAAQWSPTGADVPSTVRVEPGDTLWGIAVRVAPTADPADTVARLGEANGVRPGEPLQPGQVLTVPLR